MDIVIFEDNKTEQLFPLAELRPGFEIKAGAFSIREKTEKLFSGKNVKYHTREIFKNYAAELYRSENIFEQCNGVTLFINGKVVFTKNAAGIFPEKNNELIKSGDEIIAFTASDTKTALDIIYGNPVPSDMMARDIKGEKSFHIFTHSWDAVRYFEEDLNNDLEYMFENTASRLFRQDFDTNKIRLHENADILPNVVLDSSKGKIFIEEGATVEPFCYIRGPVYIGKKTLIKSGTKIYGPANIGYASRVAGEISGTNFHSYINKQHSGFIGNSYVCEFANLGADTVTSNLKNNYSEIRTTLPFSDESYKTGMQFLGSIIGDHSKTGINTMLNTGSIIGIFSNIAGGGFPDKLIDSFQWYISGKEPSRYKIEEALATARKVMSRRDVQMSGAYESLVREIYNIK